MTVRQILLIGLGIWTASAMASKGCWPLFTRKLFGLNPNGIVSLEGIHITGDAYYPLANILQNLDLNAQKGGAHRGRPVLLVGEGYSQLLPYLLEEGADAHAVDIWYGRQEFPPGKDGEAMKQFSLLHGDRLIEGRAENLPQSSDSVAQVLSHAVVSHFTYEQSLAFVEEALRVTRNGGNIRIFGFLRPETVAKIKSEIETQYSGIDFQSEYRSSTFERAGRSVKTDGWLVKIDVLDKKQR